MSKDEFDPEKYVERWRAGEHPATGGKTTITCGIWQYAESAPKVKLHRRGTKKDGTAYSSDAGGLTADEADACAKLLAQAAKRLREMSG